MNVFEIREAWGLEHLTAAEQPEPQPGRGEVLLRVRAVSLNYRDLLVARGVYNPRIPLPHIPVSDGAGEVAAVGEGVTRWKVGDRVVANFFPDWLEGAFTAEKAETAFGGTSPGLLREYAVVPATALLPLPEHLTFAQAATLPCAALTAWNGLFVSASLQPGQTVLLQGTGGVSIFGLQFAKLVGASPVVISSSDEKLERARALGAVHTINYKQTPGWDKAILDWTRRHGVDHILEVGGAGTLTKSLKAVAYQGHISLIGVLSGITGDVQLGQLLHKAVTVRGIYVGSVAMFAAMNRAIAQHRLEPVIDRIFPLAETPQAFRHLESGQHFGKVVIQLD